MAILQALERKRVAVRILNLGVDTQTPTGKLMLTLVKTLQEGGVYSTLGSRRAGSLHTQATTSRINLSYEYQRSRSMNRREAIIAGMAGITAAVAVAPKADAQASQAANPELEQIRALLRAHDEATT
jgi:hypothetical protein